MAQFGYTKQFGSMLSLAGITSSDSLSIFLKDVVAPYRTNIRNTRGFKETPLKPAYELTYQAILSENKIGIMANHVAFDAHSKPRRTKGFKLTSGNIPHIAANRTMGREDYLAKAKIIHDAELIGGNAMTAAQEIVRGISDGCIEEHDNRITYMRGQVVSTGQYTVTQANNDGSFTIPTFDFQVPSANKDAKTGTARWWTDDAHKVEGTTSDPVADLQNMVWQAMTEKNLKPEQLEFEVDFVTLQRTLNHSKVRESIGGSLYPTAPDDQWGKLTGGMNPEAMQTVLSNLLYGIPFVVNNDIVAVEKLNEKKGILEDVSVKAFVEDTFVLHRKGDIGEIHSAANLAVGGDDGSNGMYAEYDGGRILMTYQCDVHSRTQTWDTEETTLLVLTDSLNMFYLTVK